MLKMKFVSNEWNMHDENFQTKQSIVEEITKEMKERKWKLTFKNCMFKEKYEKIIIGMQFVRLFFV